MRKLLVLALAVASPAFAQEPDWSKIQIRATKVAGSVYMLEGTGGFAGGNIGALVGPDGILIVDDQFAPLAPKIQAALKTVSDKPVRFVLNTHYHGDHTDGNTVFGTGSTVIAHDNTRKRMAGPGWKREGGAAPPAALPVITFDDELEVHVNGEDIKAVHIPSGHTDTDVVVWFTKSNVVHMGDDFFSGMFPFIDVEHGGSIKGYIAAVEKVLAEVSADAKIIPGHGPVSTPADLRAFLAMLKETSGIVEAGIRAGKSLDDLKKAKALAKFDTWATGFLKTDDYLEELYKGLGPAPSTRK
jgi:glyoxylase-like metal-dependent hydrolase (beta-lactamase superfamily II)